MALKNTEHHYFYCALTAAKYKKPYIYVKHYLKAPFTAINHTRIIIMLYISKLKKYSLLYQ
jgi:hypothetical protein